MIDKSDSVLMVFIKYPEPGKVKTRLAIDIGYEEATQFYKEMAEYVLRTTKSQKYMQKIYFSPKEKKDDIVDWLGEMTFVPQSKGDLGTRLYSAFQREFDLGVNKVVVIGSDCPDCDAEIISTAFGILEQKDAVLGPSNDGGYYLLGLRINDKRIFEKIDWGSSTVYEQTCRKLDILHYDYELLETKRDIDTLDDLNEIRNSSFLDKACKY